MKKIEKVCGYVIMDDNDNIIGYEAANGFNNKIFKDNNEGDNVVYIPLGADWDENNFIPAEAGLDGGIYKFDDIVNVVFEVFEDCGYWELFSKSGECFADLVLETIEWEYPETCLAKLSLAQIIQYFSEKGLKITIE